MDTLLEQETVDILHGEDLLNAVMELETEINEIGEEIAAEEEDSKIGDWVYISEVLKTFRMMNSSLNQKFVLEHVMDAAISVIQAERGFLLLQNDNSEMDFKIARDAQKNTLEDCEFKVSQSVLQDAMKTKQIAYIEDTLSDQTFLASQSIQQLNLRSIVCCPMIADGELVGVIYADSSKPLIGRSKIKKQLFQLFADQAAVAIRNYQLYNVVKKAYEQLENAQERVIYAERMAERGQMAAQIGHELNNLLTGVGGNLHLAIELLEANNQCEIEEVLQRLKKVTQLVMGMERFSKGLMAHTHLDTKITQCNLNELVHESLEFIKPVYKKTGAAFKENFDANLPSIHLDKGQIQQVLYNLIKNAIEACADTRVCVSTCYNPHEEHITLHVADTGPGIEKQKLEQIFTPLFTDKANGHGYGLSICKEIIKNHGGSFSVKSEEGKGTEFIIALPIESHE